MSPKLLPLLLFFGVSVPLAAQEFVCSGYEPPARQADASAKAAILKPSRGNTHVLVVYAKFKDEDPQNQTSPTFAQQIFDDNLPGSFSHFYREMSGGQFTVSGTVLSKRYSSDRPASAYLETNPREFGRYDEFITEILTKVDRDVDLGQFDNDGPDGIANSSDDDSTVDYIFINTLSTPRGFLIGGATGIANLGSISYQSTDANARGGRIMIGGSIRHGALQQEGNFAQTVGSMAHEFGHHLGLADLYDLAYDTPEEDSAGIGRWGLMGWGAHGWNGQDGPVPFSAWSLEQLGWIGLDNSSLVEVDADASGLEVNDVLMGGRIYKVPLRLASGNDYAYSEEYLLLEQVTRSSSFYRRNLPGEGMLLWHVRPQSGGNFDETAKSVDLVCADGLYADMGYPKGRLPDDRFGRDNLDFWAHDNTYARAKAGNFGDATDPFDGVQTTRLDQHSNPSSDPGGASSSAMSGVTLTMRRHGHSMIVGVKQPRWAGTIDTKVHWADNVLVDGDVRVAPEGQLHIHPNTRVRVSGSDRLRRGLDPALNELKINGSLIVGDRSPTDVVFEALEPGESWYGILIDPADSSRIEVLSSNIVLDDVLHGFVFQRAPFALREPMLDLNVEFVDGQGEDVAGNGDGTFNPGETVQIELTLNNWTLGTFRKARPILRWDTTLLAPAWERGIWSSRFKYLTSEDSFDLYPGRSHTDVLPLTLSRAAEPGTEIQLVVEYAHQVYEGNRRSRAHEIHRDTLTVVVTGAYPENEVEFEAPGSEIQGRSVLVPVGVDTPIRALVRGEIAGADLMVRTLDESAHVMVLPMTNLGTRGDGHLFEASVPKGQEGFFETFVRLHGKNGYTTVADSSLLVGVTPITDETRVLSFANNQLPAKDKETLVEAIEAATRAERLPHYVVNGAPAEGKLYELLLSGFSGADRTVLWMGEQIGIEAQAHIRAYLERGGRMLISSGRFTGMKMAPRFPTEILHAQRSIARSNGSLRGLDLIRSEPFGTSYSSLSLLPPAEPMLFDGRYDTAAMRVDTGTFRLVYYPFDLGRLDGGIARSLLQAGLTYLNVENTAAASLELDHDETIGESVLLQGDEIPSARLRVASEVVRAELQVRLLPTMTMVKSIPLRRNATDPTSFGGPMAIDEPGSYLLSARIFDRLGRSLPNNARSRVLRLLERPNLVIVNDNFKKESRAQVRRKIEQGLAMNNTEANIVDYPEKDKSVYENLLLSYAENDKAVFWFGEFGEQNVPPMLERFLEAGGRLFLAARGVALYNMNGFLENYLFSTPRHYENRPLEQVLSRGPGMHIDLRKRVRHRILYPRDPAVPLILSDKGKVAGVHVGTGSYRAIYFAFDMIHLTNFERLMGSVVPLLHRNIRQEAEMALPEAQVANNSAVVLQGVEVPIQVTTDADVETVELIMHGSTLKRGMELPLQQNRAVDAQAKRVFRTTWRPRARGHYRFVARMQKADGRQVVGAQPLNVETVAFTEWNPVLIVNKLIRGSSTVKDVQMLLERHGLKVNTLDRNADLSDPDLYEVLMQHYLGKGRFVIWLSSMMSAVEQQAVSRYALKGGRILLATQSIAHSPSVFDFKEKILGIGQYIRWAGSGEFETARGEGDDGKIPFASVVPETGTEPVLVDIEGRVAAVRLDAGEFRTVFVGLDLRRTSAESRQRLLGEQIAFLSDGAEVSLRARLAIKSVVAPESTVATRNLRPEVLVANGGNGRSRPFSVEYQILQGGRVVASHRQQQPALEPFSERTIAFPVRASLEAGSYQLQFGLASSFEEAADFLEPHPLELVDMAVTYTTLDIPGEVSYSNGAGFFDFDGDDDLDFLLARQGFEDQLYRNDSGEFREIGKEVGWADGGMGRGFAVGDYDGDGDLDLYLVRQSQDNLLLRNESSRFSDVTAPLTASQGAALGDAGSGRSAGFWDADGDGDLDLFLVNAAPDTNRLFRNDGVAFADIAAEIGLGDAGDGRGLSFGDFDRDGDADLLVANRSGASRLYRNNAGFFADASEDLGLQFSNDDVAGIFGDYDGDGFVDLFTTGESSNNRLFKNLEGSAFIQVAETASGTLGNSCAGAAFVDADNDGDLDLVTTGVSSFNGGDQLFQNNTTSWNSVGSFAGLAVESMGRGLSPADFDADGDQDLLVADAVGSRLYRNELESSQWLQLDLVGTGANRDALGARVQLITSQGLQYKELYPGFGYGSQGPPGFHFGLGHETSIDTLRVIWPDGRESVRTGLQPNRQLRLSYPEPPMSMAPISQASPRFFTVFPNFPNPFNAETVITYYLPDPGPVKLSIYNMAGQRVRRIVAEAKVAGLHSLTWDGTDDEGRELGTGVYVYQLSTPFDLRKSRLLLIK